MLGMGAPRATVQLRFNCERRVSAFLCFYSRRSARVLCDHEDSSGGQETGDVAAHHGLGLFLPVGF